MPTCKIVVHPDVYKELEESRAWYEERVKNLGIDFLHAVDDAIDRVCEFPETWTWYEKKYKIRKFLLQRFPYAVIYRYRKNIIEIISVANLRRKPGYWKGSSYSCHVKPQSEEKLKKILTYSKAVDNDE
jgi:hypothetical protein